MIFAIEEFAVYDGPGIRTAVFFKGCPLRCVWCHNPEGWSMERQIVRNPNGCLHCGRCREVCTSKEKCKLCGKCIPVCPGGLIRFSGWEWEADELAARLMKNAGVLKATGGGITLTGGEVLLQPEFLLELLGKLSPLHRAVETSGYGDPDVFRDALEQLELVYFDIKLMDCSLHTKYTAKSNDLILKNARTLKMSGKPFIIRIPLIRGVNDDEANLKATADFLADSQNLRQVELLPYNTMAGAKYAMLGLQYHGRLAQPGEDTLERAKQIFHEAGLHIFIR